MAQPRNDFSSDISQKWFVIVEMRFVLLSFGSDAWVLCLCLPLSGNSLFETFQTWEVLGDAVFSFGCAYAMSMLFEIPVINLEKLILRPILGELHFPVGDKISRT